MHVLTVFILASTSSKKGVHFIVDPPVLELTVVLLLLLLKKYKCTNNIIHVHTLYKYATISSSNTHSHTNICTCTCIVPLKRWVRFKVVSNSKLRGTSLRNLRRNIKYYKQHPLQVAKS